MSNCTKCHELGKEVLDSKCLDCHTEIKKLADANRGYHSNNEVTSKKCFECHSEHHGRKFEIARFDQDSFNHDKTGYRLEGKHSSVKCENCHIPKFIDDQELKKRTGTFLGLNQECSSCHEDYHQGTLSNDCQSCHNSEKFRPAPKFNHDKAAYKLTGSHINVDCEKCHKKENRNDKEFQLFKGLQFNNCTPCHNDVHNNKFGSNCQKCHSTSSFKQIKQMDEFDHSLTNYPLQGKHIIVECKSCHIGGLSNKPKYEKCTDCHNDFHKGQFTKEGVITDCSKCHSLNGFIPSNYSIQEHSMLGFALSGAHLAVPCQQCHKTEKEWDFTFESTRCSECHENIHGDAISKEFIGNNECEKCHTSESWRVNNFDHSLTEFALVGNHQKVECRTCHLLEDDESKIIHVFSELTSVCEDCHNDVHFGQFKQKGKTICDRCHSPNGWKKLLFDHAATRFPLDGAHKNLQCSQCHKPVQIDAGSFINYKYDEFKCATCHS